MHRDDAIRLRHMLDAVHEAIGFAQGRTRVDLNGDRKLILALVKDIKIIGEALTRFPKPYGINCQAFSGTISIGNFPLDSPWG